MADQSKNSLKIAAGAAAVFALIGGGILLMKSPSNDSSTQQNDSAGTTVSIQGSGSGVANSTSPSDKTYSASDVAMHSSDNDCWTIIDDVVYDITAYIARHPGGDEIVRACGGDGSSLFNQRTDENGESVGSGTPHSENAKSQLEDLRIGTLQ